MRNGGHVTTYLVGYVEASDQFLVINIKDWVAKTHGDTILTATQKTFTVRVSKSNPLDHNAFRRMMEANLVPTIRERLRSGAKEAEAFLRASEIVKWLALRQAANTPTRLRLVKYMSKMRSEVYFEEQDATSSEWATTRVHWEYAMGPIGRTFPFLRFASQRLAQLDLGWIEEDYDGETYRRPMQKVTWLRPETGDEIDDDEIENEAWLTVDANLHHYGDIFGNEMIEHCLDISLNAVGEKWSALLNALEGTRILSIDTTPKWVSVAPWHARDL